MKEMRNFTFLIFNNLLAATLAFKIRECIDQGEEG